MTPKTTLRLNPEDLDQAAALLTQGGLVALPTETVYGLAADSLNGPAVESIYAAKGRPEQKPLSVLLTGMDMVEQVCENIPPLAYRLAEKFWPGPLTMVLKSRGNVPPVVTAGGETLGVRCPDHALTLEVIRRLGRPLAAPSANLSGRPSPKTAQEALEGLNGRIDGVLDGGACTVGVESTIVDLTGPEPQILRQGGLPEVEIIRTAAELTARREGAGIKVIGITGGTGAGKTTALHALETFHALVLDADEIYHELTENSKELQRELTGRFGEVYDPNGKLDRKQLGAVVFQDPAALADLNAITHRYVGDEVDRRLAQARDAGCHVAAIDAIALIESGLSMRCDCTVAITAPVDVRVRRIMARENISEEYARMRIAAQKDAVYFKAHCDYVLENTAEDTPETFSARALSLFRRILD